MNRWKALFHLCWLLGHHHQLILDFDARKSFNRCSKCGDEFQYDFQRALTPDWIGWCDRLHSCPLCMGWKPKDWDRCGNEICKLNPNGPLRKLPGGHVGYLLDGPHQSSQK